MNAIVTGFNSGIGEEISKNLSSNNYNIIKLTSRLEDVKSLENEINHILTTVDIDLLVNCAGLGVFKPHEEISIAKIQELINVNLTAPIVLCNLLLRNLKKTSGHIINITSIEALRHSKFSALYTATKSGLRDFSLSLFEECRKSGVKVTSINPDITNTSFFDEFNFKPLNSLDTCIRPETIAKVILDVVRCKSTITDLTIRPQKFGISKNT